jgi:hypothetical protein
MASNCSNNLLIARWMTRILNISSQLITATLGLIELVAVVD